jgi:CBS domain-containing protein
MAKNNIGALLVINDTKPVGIFSERDYARKLALKGKNERDTLVEEVMTSRVIGIQEHQDVDECLRLMTEKFIRHLPVVSEDGQVVGVISIGDVVKELVADQAFVIDQLVNYITGEKSNTPIPKKSDVEISRI